jgi:hypothetical protein
MDPHRLRRHVGTLLLAVIAVAAEPTATAAVTSATPTRPACAAAFNAPLNARWHAYAQHIDARHAAVGLYSFVHAGKGGAVRPACGVLLVLGKRPQYRAAVYGAWRGVGRTRFAPPPGQTAPTPQRQRTTAPLNALVLPNGTLRLVA